MRNTKIHTRSFELQPYINEKSYFIFYTHSMRSLNLDVRLTRSLAQAVLFKAFASLFSQAGQKLLNLIYIVCLLPQPHGICSYICFILFVFFLFFRSFSVFLTTVWRWRWPKIKDFYRLYIVYLLYWFKFAGVHLASPMICDAAETKEYRRYAEHEN